MISVSENKKIADMTVGEFRQLIRETIYETIDPDYGLRLRPEIEEELKNSLESKTRIPVEDAAKKLGLEW